MDPERQEARAWIIDAMRALDAKDYIRAWTFCNQALIRLTAPAAQVSRKAGEP